MREAIFFGSFVLLRILVFIFFFRFLHEQFQGHDREFKCAALEITQKYLGEKGPVGQQSSVKLSFVWAKVELNQAHNYQDLFTCVSVSGLRTCEKVKGERLRG